MMNGHCCVVEVEHLVMLKCPALPHTIYNMNLYGFWVVLYLRALMGGAPITTNSITNVTYCKNIPWFIQNYIVL